MNQTLCACIKGECLLNINYNPLHFTGSIIRSYFCWRPSNAVVALTPLSLHIAISFSKMFKSYFLYVERSLSLQSGHKKATMTVQKIGINWLYRKSSSNASSSNAQLSVTQIFQGLTSH